jgi:hypothetical protein
MAGYEPGLVWRLDLMPSENLVQSMGGLSSRTVSSCPAGYTEPPAGTLFPLIFPFAK